MEFSDSFWFKLTCSCACVSCWYTTWWF